ncbi:hypothetical protein BFJ69_g7878 [Fusarium oxysporum]|uniref:T6SS Phospholipase effector Tle1-like catalytic domain-containing protein n=1 Tax=Fusarium oxysporum TaxID=5507 RepID=A0A420N4D5_FUSOX|nr:hypothetical protein BFJ69_g7878 [Fusarium oxysporum]
MPEETPKLASYKRIILCSDGTWLASDTGDKSTPSNVAKLARAVANNGPDAKGNIVKQIVSYHSGLGSGDLPFQKAIYGGFGWGLDIEVSQIYDFISNNYEPGDELFFFGFSRGAFTVRSVAGLVCDVGVLSAVHMSRFTEMWEAYRANTSGEPFRNSAWYRNNKEELGLTDVRVKVVGVWDTVGALGIPEWPVVDNLSNMLTFEDAAIKILIKEHHRALNSINIPSGWGCGPIVNNFSGLQGLFFWLLGKKDREPGSYPRDPGDGTSGATNEYFHPITRIRKEILGYNPMPLRGYSIERPHGSAGWKWVKSGVQSIPEYVMHPEKKMSVAYEENGRVNYRVESSLSRLLCPENILLDLDRDNGI